MAGRRNSSKDQTLLQQVLQLLMELGAELPFAVSKQKNGQYRWIAVTSSSYEDRDGEVVTRKAQEKDTQELSRRKDYGPLRWYHVGKPVYVGEKSWRNVGAGRGIDIGTTDFSSMVGKLRVESGLITLPGIGRKMASQLGKWELSIAFSHPPDQPKPTTLKGKSVMVFEDIHTFERSLLPRSVASNLMTRMFSVKEQSMTDILDPNKVKQFKEAFGEDADAILQAVVAISEKAEVKAEQSHLTDKAGLPAFLKDEEKPKEEGESEDEPTEDEPTEDETEEKKNPTKGKSFDAEPMLIELKEQGDEVVVTLKEVGVAVLSMKAALDALGGRLAKAEKQIRQLNGDLPRALKGYRASEDPETERKEGDTGRPTQDPVFSLVDALDGVK